VNNPFKQSLPVVVVLRNATLAVVEQLVGDVPAFPLLGRLGNDERSGCELGTKAGAVHLPPERAATLWRADGAWRENGQKSEFDIVGVVLGRDQYGSLVCDPFAPAAGKKEAA
jgi:hypothetical protein